MSDIFDGSGVGATAPSEQFGGLLSEPPLSPAIARPTPPPQAVSEPEPAPPEPEAHAPGMLERKLLQFGMVTMDQLGEAMREEAATGRPVAGILMERGWVTQEQIAQLFEPAAPPLALAPEPVAPAPEPVALAPEPRARGRGRGPAGADPRARPDIRTAPAARARARRRGPARRPGAGARRAGAGVRRHGARHRLPAVRALVARLPPLHPALDRRADRRQHVRAISTRPRSTRRTSSRSSRATATSGRTSAAATSGPTRSSRSTWRRLRSRSGTGQTPFDITPPSVSWAAFCWKGSGVDPECLL